MTSIRLVVIGGCKTFNGSPLRKQDFDVTEWNNFNQVGHYTLVMLKQEYPDIEIICIDELYQNDAFVSGIKYIKEYVQVTEVDKFLDEKSHNIIIEFCNLYGVTWTSHKDYKPYIDSKYKVSLLACGCMWDDGFPKDAFDRIVKNKLYTHYDLMNIDSYLTAIGYTSSINETYMKPFMIGIQQILGSVMYRGCVATGYECEKPLRELFQIVEPPLNPEQKEEFQGFLDKSKHWNHLSREIKEKISQFIYGDI